MPAAVSVPVVAIEVAARLAGVLAQDVVRVDAVRRWVVRLGLREWLRKLSMMGC